MSFPLYDYVCQNSACAEHGIEKEIRVRGSEKDAQRCELCDEPLFRIEIGTPFTRTNMRFVTKAVLTNGQEVAGHFHRSERKNKLNSF